MTKVQSLTLYSCFTYFLPTCSAANSALLPLVSSAADERMHTPQLRCLLAWECVQEAEQGSSVPKDTEQEHKPTLAVSAVYMDIRVWHLCTNPTYLWHVRIKLHRSMDRLNCCHFSWTQASFGCYLWWKSEGIQQNTQWARWILQTVNMSCTVASTDMYPIISRVIIIIMFGKVKGTEFRSTSSSVCHTDLWDKNTWKKTTIWNSLPGSYKISNSIDNFKRRIKASKTLKDFTFNKEACLITSKDSQFTYF